MLKRFLGHLIHCKRATRLVSRMQERPLGRMDRLLLELHLAWCVACRRFSVQMRFMRHAMQKYRE
jgi:Putative zinc-finger